MSIVMAKREDRLQALKKVVRPNTYYTHQLLMILVNNKISDNRNRICNEKEMHVLLASIRNKYVKTRDKPRSKLFKLKQYRSPRQ